MAHPAQWHYCESVRQRFPDQFRNARVLDVGSLDINGSNRPFFTNCIYTGLDIGPGSNPSLATKDPDSNSPICLVRKRKTVRVRRWCGS